MTAAPLDDVAFLARSDHRVAVLDTLADGPRTRRDLHEGTGISQPTLGRILGDFEGLGWADREGRTYRQTALGALVDEEFGDLLVAVETVQRVGDVLAALPAEELAGLDLRAFADATVHRPEPGDRLSHIRRMETVWFEADRTRLLGSTLGPASMDERKTHARRLVDGEATMTVETIVSAPMATQGMSDPELWEMVLEHWDPERMRAYLYDGPIPLILCLADGVAMLAPTDDHGIPTVVVESEDERVRAWVESRLDAYRAASTEFTPYDLPF